MGEMVGTPKKLTNEEKLAQMDRDHVVVMIQGKTKVLSLWPTTARLRLPKAWQYLGKRQTLRNGRYTWFVWPALGTRAKPRYGRPLGSSTFVIRGGA